MHTTQILNTRGYVNTSDVTRFEIIDHRLCCECEGSGLVAAPGRKKSDEPKQQCVRCGGAGMSGRTVVVHDKSVSVDVELQDDDRTLKVFIHERYE